MGVSISRQLRYAPSNSSQIQLERQMKKEREKGARITKVLLLGAGESGKSTILKQMKIAYNESGLNLVEHKCIIFSNVIHNMISLLDALLDLDIPLTKMKRNTDAEIVRDAAGTLAEIQCGPFPPRVSKAIRKLWKDPAVQLVYARRNEFQISDSTKYFFDHLLRVANPDYIPTREDVLYCQAKTTGIVEVSFKIRNMELRMFDVGGQRSQRKKWLNCFEGVTAVLFITSLSEYDQFLFEDATTNRMEESLRLFESVCNMEWFVNSSMILFLNKKDLFYHKIRTTPLRKSFPDYQGPDEFEPCVEWVEAKFVSLQESVEKEVYTHRTCATDTNQVKTVLNTVIDMVIGKNLKSFGFY